MKSKQLKFAAGGTTNLCYDNNGNVIPCPPERLVKEVPKGYTPIPNRPNYFQNPQQSGQRNNNVGNGTLAPDAKWIAFLATPQGQKWQADQQTKKQSNDIVYIQPQQTSIKKSARDYFAQEGDTYFDNKQHIGAKVYNPIRNGFDEFRSNNLNIPQQPVYYQPTDSNGKNIGEGYIIPGDELNTQSPGRVVPNEAFLNKFKPNNSLVKTFKDGGNVCYDTNGKIIPCKEHGLKMTNDTPQQILKDDVYRTYKPSNDIYLAQDPSLYEKSFYQTILNNKKGIPSKYIQSLNEDYTYNVNQARFDADLQMGNIKKKFNYNPLQIKKENTFNNTGLSYKKGGYINDNGRYVHKDGKTTSKPGLWSNVYMKKQRMDFGGFPCPEGFTKDESGNCVEDNGYNPQQSLNKGMPIVPMTNENNQMVGGTGANVATPTNPALNQMSMKREFGMPNRNNILGFGLLTAGLQSFANGVDTQIQEEYQAAQYKKRLYSNLTPISGQSYGVKYGYNKYGGMLNKFEEGGETDDFLNLLEDDEDEQPTKIDTKNSIVSDEDVEKAEEERQMIQKQKRMMRYQQAMDVFNNSNQDSNQAYNTNQSSNVNPNDTINKVGNYFLSKGYNKEFVSGVLGNIHAESNGRAGVNEQNPTSGKGGYGLFQHTGQRRNQLLTFAQQNNLDASDPITQAMFAEQEPQFQSAYKASQGKTPGQAAVIFENKFEKAGIKRLDTRIKAANSFYNKFQEGGTYNLSPAEVIKMKKSGFNIKYID